MLDIKRVENKLEKKINKIKNQLYEDCDGSESDNWKLKFIFDLNNILIKIQQNEVNPVYILSKGRG